jgi:uncharacterized protein YprB with RNaseH-like and TPR domain
LLERPGEFDLAGARTEIAVQCIEASVKALQESRHQFFNGALSPSEAWRAWPNFQASCVYLDIETDGGRSGSSITTVGLWNGREFECLVRGESLENFRDVISHYQLIVTFFGENFDLPLLRKRFRNLRFDQIHIDLCPTLRQLGLKGGLKSIEKQLGIARGDDTDGLDGRDAIRLWNRYRALRDEDALRQLIAYNREDVVNLEFLVKYAYDRLRARRLPTPSTASPLL